jgi:hypothetical protein
MEYKTNLYDNEIFFHLRHTPDDNRITVLSRGSSKGLIASIPKGGH